MNYEQMSDFEINQAVAKALGYEISEYQLYSGAVKCFDMHCTSMEPIELVFDYCNHPADAWPVIFDSKISIIWDPDYNTYHVGAQFTNLAGCEGGGYDFRGQSVMVSDNPLRAAMIVFLMMQEASA